MREKIKRRKRIKRKFSGERVEGEGRGRGGAGEVARVKWRRVRVVAWRKIKRTRIEKDLGRVGQGLRVRLGRKAVSRPSSGRKAQRWKTKVMLV